MTFIGFFEEIVKFIRSAFSEDDGSGSSSRLLAGAVVLSVITWITYFVFKHGTIPDLSGPSLFLGSGTSATYGLNQAKAVVTAWQSGSPNGGTNVPAPQPTPPQPQPPTPQPGVQQ